MMKKKIIIEEESNKDIIKEDRDDKTKVISNKLFEWIIYMFGYAIVLIMASVLFESFEINSHYFGLYAFLGAIIIYLLNQTVKPLIVYLTLPITAITLGLFYPLINVLILYITSFILGKENFYISGIFIPFFIAIFISFLNILMESIIIKPFIYKRRNKHE